MAVLEILTYPDERLKQESLPVEKFDDELRAFIVDLEETMCAGRLFGYPQAGTEPWLHGAD